MSHTDISVRGVSSPPGMTASRPVASEPVGEPAPRAPEAGYEFARVVAVFNVDPETSEVSVTVLNEKGEVLRTIPPATIAEMVSSLNSYPRS
jgi:hypothetical protein